MFFLFALIFTLFTHVAEAKHCLFNPPPDWEIAQLKNPSPFVIIGFLGKSEKGFRPSLNLATEEVDVSLKEYIKAVKELQSADPNTQWRDLGKISMRSGAGRLTEMTSPSAWGELKILQAILIEERTAYILTAALLKEDFPKLQNDILKSFQSLSLIPSLWTPIADLEKRSHFENLFKGLGKTAEKELQWQAYQKQVSAQSELGLYWQFLALKEGKEKLYRQEIK